MGAAADCEAIGSGFLGQPANALTTVAFVLVGLWILYAHPGARWTGIALMATGIGSFLFHGPMPSGNEWAHDVSLAWLLAMVAGAGTRWERLTRLPTLALVGLIVALAPAAADPLAVLLSVVAIVSTVRHTRNMAPLALAGAVGIYGRLGATAGPLCNPTSWWQPHGIWHIAAALAVGWLIARESTSGPLTSPGA
ncbi:hypothetical protein BH18ACT5_BH18ACT5_11860 [soil metagenome]